jgi:hypothetical protein
MPAALLQDGRYLPGRGVSGVHHDLNWRAIISRFLHQLLCFGRIIGDDRNGVIVEVHLWHIGIGHFAISEVDHLQDGFAVGGIVERQTEVLVVERLLLVVQIDVV